MSGDTGKTALITGAAGGIGRALVQVFASAGYRVIGTDLVDRIPHMPCAHYIRADLARYVREEDYALEVNARLQHALDDNLDVLVHNAAVQILGASEILSREDWRTTLDVNLLAPFFLTQSMIPHLERGDGCVINIGSIHARLTKANFVAYASSKAALAGMTRALAVDLGPRVRINAIEPAAIETEMLAAGFAGRLEQYARLKGCHPQKRLGTPEEVAQLAFAIAAGGMKFMHGACVGIDGGIGALLHDPD